jgi:hypothetical protein
LAEIPRATKADLERLRRAMQGTIDTSDLSERRKLQPLKRDAQGKLPTRKSSIRDAVEREMRLLHLTTYRLWLRARLHYPTLSQSAVHEFLKGARQLELPSVEALLAAVDLEVTPRNNSPRIARRPIKKRVS